MSSSLNLKLKKYFTETALNNASDLHLSEGRAPTLRIDGKLVEIPGERVMTPDVIEGCIDILLNPERKKIYLRDKTLDFSYEFEGKARFRINVFFQRGQMSLAARLIPSKILGLEKLGLPKELKRFTEASQGLVLVVGPTGHGKTTTLATLVDVINHNYSKHIITVEDPIEYMFIQDKCIVDQRELYQDTNSFPESLRSSLREDMDVTMVGEMRDLETIATAITVAETGHLVFSTLHTNNAPETIDRIIDVFPADQQNQIRVQLANILLGVVSQRLVPRIGGGRVPVIEIMIVNSAVRNLIRESKTHQINSVLQTSASEGMVPLDKSLAELVKTGEILMADAMLYANDQDNLQNLVRG